MQNRRVYKTFFLIPVTTLITYICEIGIVKSKIFDFFPLVFHPPSDYFYLIFYQKRSFSVIVYNILYSQPINGAQWGFVLSPAENIGIKPSNIFNL